MGLHNLDEAGNIYFACNQATIDLLGYDSKDDVVGKNIADISPPIQPNGVPTGELALRYLGECREKGQKRIEWVHLRKDGSPIWLDIVLTLIRFKNQEFVHALWRDMTEIKKYEDDLLNYQTKLEELVKERTAKLENANAQLVQSNLEIQKQHQELEDTLHQLKNAQGQLIQSEKMASLGILTAGVAHEINNPLNYILGSYTGFAKYFKENKPEDESVELLMGALHTGVTKATNIVKGLNQFSRSQETLDESCDLHLILDDCVLMLNHELKDRISLSKNYSKDSSVIRGNVGKLHQAFLNILMNASQSIVGKGKISISTQQEDSQVEVRIEDNGSGISDEHLKKITDPFFTTKEPGKGTGLGLSITYKIIKEHNGEIVFESEEGKGTRVYIKLPVNSTPE